MELSRCGLKGTTELRIRGREAHWKRHAWFFPLHTEERLSGRSHKAQELDGVHRLEKH